MSVRRICLLAVGVVAVALFAAPGCANRGRSRSTGRHTDAHRTSRIRPDYAGIVVPPNIAPLNFTVEEPGRRYRARISANGSGAIEVAADRGSIRIPPKPWRALLEANRGGEIVVEVDVQDEAGQWTRFDPIRNRVAPDNVDDYLVYRLIGPVYNNWTEMGIYQRDLRSFTESAVMRNRETDFGCMNCHTFLNNRPDTFLLHTRPEKGGNPGMLIARDGKASRVDTRTPGDPRPAVYSSWHPSGRLIACSQNKIRQFFHTAGEETRDVIDLASGLAIYSVDEGTVSRPAVLNKPDRLETFPTWSPDGRFLYFCSARTPWPEPKPVPHDYVEDARYDLMRISFDIETGRWGEPETVLSAGETGKSILEPRVSPDGRFLLFCTCDYGSFPVFQRNTDLHVMDLRGNGRRYWRLFPDEASWRDSWHCWSSNGRWIVFSRKRENGVLARPHFSYIDAAGKASKPLVMPQADPTFYDRCVKTYNAPELVTGPVAVSEEELSRAFNSGEVRKATNAP